jgi:hypothetical protein
MQKSLFSEMVPGRPAPISPKLILTLSILLIAGSLAVGGCAFGDIINLGGENPPTEPAGVLPTSTIQNSPLPEPTLEEADPFPDLEGEFGQSFPFEYLCNPYSVSLPLHQSSFEYFYEADKRFHYRGSLPDDWQEQFYLMFLSSPHDLEVLNELIDRVKTTIGQTGDDLVLALTSLVQELTYDCDKLFSYDHLDGEGYQTNYPYETLYTKLGVCGDTSILLSKILQELGYGAALLIYEESNHMALGIQCPLEVAAYVEDQIGYCYIETTGPTRIGVKPVTLGGTDFIEEPWIIPIAEGQSFTRMINLAEEMEADASEYGDKILQLATCQEIQLYREIQDRQVTITAQDGRLASLNIKMNQAESEFLAEREIFNSMGCEGTLLPAQYDLCMAQIAVVEEKFAVYDDLVNNYNRVVNNRNFEVTQMNQAIDAFNSLMDAKDQSCAVVWSERIEIQEEE